MEARRVAEREASERERAEREEQTQAEQQREWERQRQEALHRQRMEQEQQQRLQEREHAVRVQQQKLLQEAERRRQEAIERERAMAEEHKQAEEEERRQELLRREQLLQQPAMPPSRHAAGAHAALSSGSFTGSTGAPISTSFAELQGRQDAGGGMPTAAPPSLTPSSCPMSAAPMSLTFAELQGRQGGAAGADGSAASQPPSSRVSAAPLSMSMQELHQRHGPAPDPPSARSNAPSSSRHAPISSSFQELQSRQGGAGATMHGAPGSRAGSLGASEPRSHAHAPISESFHELQHRQAPGASFQSCVRAPTSVSTHELQTRNLQPPSQGAEHAGGALTTVPLASPPAAAPSHPGSPPAIGGDGDRDAPAMPAHGNMQSMQAQIAALMRDASLSPQERQRRIQDLRAGKVPAAPSCPGGDASSQSNDGARVDDDDGAPQTPEPGAQPSNLQAQIAALMRDASLTPQERQRRIQDLRVGKAPVEGGEDSPPAQQSPPSNQQPAASASAYNEAEVADPRHAQRERTDFQPESSGVEAGTRLVLPSELKKGIVKRKKQKDWGECMLTFDKIREAVKAADGHIYERWAIEKWLSENGNRSPLTNQVIAPDLVVLTDEDEGQGARFVETPTAAVAAADGDEDSAVGRGDDARAQGRVGKLVVNEFLSEEERKKRAAEKRASYMESQMRTQREQEEAEASRMENERMDKLKRRGFAGYSPPTQSSGAGNSVRSPSSGSVGNLSIRCLAHSG